MQVAAELFFEMESKIKVFKLCLRSQRQFSAKRDYKENEESSSAGNIKNRSSGKT